MTNKPITTLEAKLVLDVDEFLKKLDEVEEQVDRVLEKYERIQGMREEQQ